MSLLLDALNRAQKNKEVDPEETKDASTGKNVDMEGLDMEGLDLDSANDEKISDDPIDDIVVTNKNVSADKDFPELVSEDKETSPLEISNENTHDNVAQNEVKLVDDTPLEFVSETLSLDENQPPAVTEEPVPDSVMIDDGLGQFDNLSLEVVSEEPDKPRSEITETIGQPIEINTFEPEVVEQDTVSLKIDQIEPEIAARETAEPKIETSEIVIPEIAMPEIATPRKEAPQIATPQIETPEAATKEITATESKKAEITAQIKSQVPSTRKKPDEKNTINVNKPNVDTKKVSQKGGKKSKISDILGRISTFSRSTKDKQSLAKTGGRKVVFTSLAAIVVSGGIAFAGYSYYIDQINQLGNDNVRFTNRSLTPIGAVPPEEATLATQTDNAGTDQPAEPVINKPAKAESKSTSAVKKPTPIKTVEKKASPARKTTNSEVKPKQAVVKPPEKAKIKPQKQSPAKARLVKESPIEKIPVKAKPKPKLVTPLPRHSTSSSPIHALLITAFDAFQMGNDASAQKDYFSVLNMEKNNRDALLGLGAIAVRQKQFDLARNYYTQILKRDQGDSIARAALVGLVGQLDPVKAETELKLMLKKEPGAGYLHFALGNTYALQQRWLEAQSSFFNAYRTDGNNPDYAYNIAVSLDHMGETKSAIKYYKHALKHSENRKVSFDRQQVQTRVDSLNASSSRGIR